MNNGLVHTGAGVIHGAHQIKANHQGLNQAVSQGVQSGDLTAAQHQDIHQERQQIGQMERQDKQNGPVDACERQQIRQAQNQVAGNIDNFEAGNSASSCPQPCPPPPAPAPAPCPPPPTCC